LESLPEENALHVIVTVKVNPQKVIDFPLLEVGSSPDGCNGGYCRILAVEASGLEDKAVVVFQRDQMVDYLEVIEVIDCGEVGQVVEV